MKFPVTLILSGIFIAYIMHSIWSLMQLFVPPRCLSGQRCLESYLSNNPALQLFAFTSVRRSPTAPKDVKLLYKDFKFSYKEPFEKILTFDVPGPTRNNGTLFLHLWVSGAQSKKAGTMTSAELWQSLMQDSFAVHTSVKLAQHKVPEAAAFRLLSEGGKSQETSQQDVPVKAPETPVSHLKPRVDFALMSDSSTLPTQTLPPEIAYLLRLAPDGKFLPILQYNFLTNRLTDLVEVTKETLMHNFTLAYTPVGVGKLRLWLHLENGLRSLKDLGFSSKDVDDVKGIFADTNIYLLCTTIFVAALHLLFDFLALKNDVSFWRSTQSMVGLSTRTVLWRAFSQCVVFLYLLDENTSMLVLVPSGLTVLVELWKAKKCLRVQFSWRGLVQGPSLQGEGQTREFDQQCMAYLQYILWPACISGAIYSLMYEPHKGWYSWTVHSMVRGVYAFGFLFMLPQLFVNYKLRSVAHLPWRAFMYKAFNTFIDDLFAFTITMPTAHRVACFRDDFVFLIYLYQRWLYPVDKKRKDGGAGEEVQEQIHDKTD